MVWEVWETFTGTVMGCGTGRFDWYGTGTVDFSRPNQKTQTFPMAGTLRIVGAGEGGLAGMTGSLPVSAQLKAAPFPFEQHGTVLGEVTCDKRT